MRAAKKTQISRLRHPARRHCSKSSKVVETQPPYLQHLPHRGGVHRERVEGYRPVGRRHKADAPKFAFESEADLSPRCRAKVCFWCRLIVSSRSGLPLFLSRSQNAHKVLSGKRTTGAAAGG